MQTARQLLTRARLAAPLAGLLACVDTPPPTADERTVAPEVDAEVETNDSAASVVPTRVILERGDCLTKCSSYRVSVSATGEVDWLGRAHVRTIGSASKRVDAAPLEPLFAELAEVDFSIVPRRMGDPGCTRWLRHRPPAAISLIVSDRSVDFAHDGGCMGSAPYDALLALEDRIAALAEIDAWVDRAYVDCVRRPFVRVGPDLHVWDERPRPGLTEAEVARVVARELLGKHTRLRLLSHASVREPAGASRARADAFVEAFTAAGGDLARMEVVDCGSELALRALDDDQIWADEGLDIELFDPACVEAGRGRPRDW